MILLDTNVLSEPMKPVPNFGVLAWLDAQPTITLHTSTVNEFELREGIARLPIGRRRTAIEQTIDSMLSMLIGSRLLPFDSAAARECAARVAAAKRNGLAVLFADAQIAAIAAVHGLTVATRDTSPFSAMSVPVINPWEA